VTRLVDRILAAKQRDAAADVNALSFLAEALRRRKREIDHLMYALYDLTPDEIRIGESKA